MSTKGNDKMNKNNSYNLSSRSERSQKCSKVLLVCVYDTIVFQLTNDVIYSKFQKFGAILKLLIFQKGQVTKFFIEYQDLNQAINAKQTMDGAKLCQNICKMTIYYSNFNNVDLKHQTSLGMDYIPQEEIKNQFVQKFDILTKGSQKQFNYDAMHDQMIMNSFDSFANFSRSKTDDPRLLQEHFKKMAKIEQQYIGEQYELEHSIEDTFVKQIDILLDQKMENENELSKQKVPKMKQSTPIKSSILAVKLRYEVQIYKLYNLFSNFGNISWIVNKKNYVYIKFRNVEFAAIACTYLNNSYLYGNLLNIQETYQNQQQIFPHEGEYAECIFYDHTFDRFTPHRSITINPPSLTLHVSSIKRELCKQFSLRKLFNDYGAVEKVHILHQSYQKNMALIKFYSIEDSFKAISSLHNKLIMGRKMQISFTKSKL